LAFSVLEHLEHPPTFSGFYQKRLSLSIRQFPVSKNSAPYGYRATEPILEPDEKIGAEN
jgi:hypothetical protein